MSERRRPLSDPKAMRALAHPARLAMINRLAVVGSATATELAEVAGVTPSAASYHLRMLAKYGFVEDAPPRGDGRERLWKNVRDGFSIEYEPGDALETRAAKQLLIDALWKDQEDAARRALARLEFEPEEWRDATAMNSATLLMTAQELKELGERIDELVQPYSAGSRRQEGVPEGARVVQAHIRLFPSPERRVPGLPTEDHDRARGEAAADRPEEGGA
ncbi:ArsR/SmtB family transcription factor [Thermoactinospora rubra]|uniref:ArsR/SmtB family transcription factor n=1 Tax=Thermoactinospora rubra TaxID=1088767 RepID=UPI000A1015F4|nr:helix-turn-helix domain-containing protein [Thermoactinospora rubra]